MKVSIASRLSSLLFLAYSLHDTMIQEAKQNGDKSSEFKRSRDSFFESTQTAFCLAARYGLVHHEDIKMTPTQEGYVENPNLHSYQWSMKVGKRQPIQVKLSPGAVSVLLAQRQLAEKVVKSVLK